jgi:glutamate synthase (NADPH/NADH) small chain
MARAAKPGQFVIVMEHEHGERIPLTIADFDPVRGTITLVIQAVGKTTREMQQNCVVGTHLYAMVGPMGIPSELGKVRKVVCVGGGLGVAPVYPQARAYKHAGAYVIGILGFRNRDLMFWEDKFRAVCDELIVCTDDGSAGLKGLVTTGIAQAIAKHGDIDEVVAIGPPMMMKGCAEATRKHKIKTMVSLNPVMVDGTGMCGGCRVKIGDRIGRVRRRAGFRRTRSRFRRPMARLGRCRPTGEGRARKWQESCRLRGQAMPRSAVVHRRWNPCGPTASATPDPGSETFVATAKKKTIRTIPQERTPMREQDPKERAHNFKEVTVGYALEEALNEAERCLMCVDPPCVRGCPVGIDIPGFIKKISDKHYHGAYDVITDTNLLPAVCGRVCPQEHQCEGVCTVGESLEPVAIGRLERFVGDMAISEGWANVPYIERNGFKVGIVGSGPAGMACAADMAKAGCDVTVYEAFHEPGGVLKYGIPDFRLPNAVIDVEIEKLTRLGIKFECNTLVGRLFTIEQMITEMGFHTVFIGTGAGYPSFMGIPGESLNGVLSANELLTRCNLMRARDFPDFDTPLQPGRRVAVIGAGNTAMDAMRVSLRLGAEHVYCVYRRTKAEAPARAEEIHHAGEEGVEFHWLTSPVELLADNENRVRGMRCVRMELGEPDASGRRRPVPVPGSDFEIETDMVVFAIGTNANPILGQTSKLKLDQRGYIATDENLATSMGVNAGGDIVTGAATVIEAMGAAAPRADSARPARHHRHHETHREQVPGGHRSRRTHLRPRAPRVTRCPHVMRPTTKPSPPTLRKPRRSS